MTKNKIRSYHELITIPDYRDRFEYLKLGGSVGDLTFGGHRYLNQQLYRDAKWRNTRRRVIIRDLGRDMAHEDYEINGKVFIHHINPITIDDILNRRECIFDEDNLVCVSEATHNAIHYGDASLLVLPMVVRKENDTCPWRC